MFPHFSDDAQNRVLGNSDAEFEQFVANALRAPEIVGNSHLYNQLANLSRNSPGSFSPCFRKSLRYESVKISLPPQNCIDFNQLKRAVPAFDQFAVDNPEEPIPVSKLWLFNGPFKDGDLLKQRKDEDLLFEDDGK